MNVPSLLAERPNWIVWAGDKVPFNARTAKPASSTDSRTWSTLEQALSAFASGSYSGLGFVFAPNDGLFGFDIDGCVSSDGEIAPWAMALVEQFGSYAEYSPTGSGIKVFGIGTPKACKSLKLPLLPKVSAIKTPGVEVYDRGRYFCFTGEQCGDASQLVECQAALDAIFDQFWPTPVVPITASRLAPLAGDIEQRASMYLDRVPPAISGQSGHNATFRAACILVLGFGLSPERALPILERWNINCQPPWSDKQLRHKLEDANKQEGSRGWLLDGRGYVGNDVELKLLLASLNSESSAPSVVASGAANTPASGPPESDILDQSPGDFPAECFDVPGLIKEIVDYNLRTALYPQPEMALAAAISLMSVITGRKVADARGTRTNSYVLCLAPSGSGKEHARKINKQILLHAGAEKMLGPERIASHAGMVTAVAESPAILFQLDEIGRLIATMRSPEKAPHLYNIGTVLMQLYSSADSMWVGDAYADTKKTKRINQPHACVYGTTVPGSFWSSLTSENISDGLLGRMMVFEAKGFVDMQPAKSEAPPESIVAAVKQWLAVKCGSGNLSDDHPTPLVASYSQDAQARLDRHFTDIHNRRKKESETVAAVWSRSGEKASKLALLFACSRCTAWPPAIELEDVDRAIRMSNWLTRRIIFKAAEHISENETESRSKRVLRLFNGKALSSSDVYNKTRWLRPRERQEILSDLVECGLLLVEQGETKGRPALFYKRPQVVASQ